MYLVFIPMLSHLTLTITIRYIIPHFMEKEVEVSRICFIQASGSLLGKFGTQIPNSVHFPQEHITS